MPSTEPAKPLIQVTPIGRWLSRLSALLVAAGCTSPPPPAPPPRPGPAPAPAPTARPAPSPAPAPQARRARSWDEYRVSAAQRITAVSRERSYDGPPPEPLLAIPVLEIELNADGSVRRVNVMRQPGQARDTVQLAIDAIHRAAPFGDVTHLPRPWRFTEVFLFNNDRRFKLRSLDN